MRAIRDRLGRLAEAGRDRFRQRGRRSVAWMTRLTLVALGSYVVASLVFPASEPLLAPLTALLVVQLTPVSILTTGVQRVISVVIGVMLAVLFSSLVHITWWSLGIVIAVSLLIGQLLRLGSNLLEVPISAMLVLGVGSRTADSAAWQRVAETLVGAGVGVASNLLFPPKITTADAAGAIQRLGDDLARLLDSAAHDVDDELSTAEIGERAWRWLGDARRLTHDIPNVGNELLRAEESRRLNLRALASADSGPGLRQGLESMEHSALALRSMFRSFVEAAQSYHDDDRELDRDVRTATAALLEHHAGVLRAYGRLVRADAVGPEEHAREELDEALTKLREARGSSSELLLVDPRHDPALAMLTSSLLATTERLLQEFSPDQRVRPTPPRGALLPHRLAPRPRRNSGVPRRSVRRRPHPGTDQ